MVRPSTATSLATHDCRHPGRDRSFSVPSASRAWFDWSERLSTESKKGGATRSTFRARLRWTSSTRPTFSLLLSTFYSTFDFLLSTPYPLLRTVHRAEIVFVDLRRHRAAQGVTGVLVEPEVNPPIHSRIIDIVSDLFELRIVSANDGRG